MKNFFKYLKVDLYRCFCSFRFFVAVVVVVGILLLGLQETNMGYENQDVFSYFIFTMCMMPHMLILSAAEIAYGGSLFEDLEHTFIRSEIMRGNLRSFVVSRVIMIFLSAQCVVAIGTTIFTAILHMLHPWVIKENSGMYEMVLNNGMFCTLVENEHYFLCFSLWGIIYGVLAGVLAVVSTWISLYIPSRMLMLVSPVVVYYFVEVFVGNHIIESFDLSLLFTIDYCWTSNTGIAMLVLIAIAVISISFFGYLIYRKLKRGGVVCG